MIKSNRRIHEKTVSTYLTQEQFELLDKAALDENISISSFVRRLILKALKDS